MSVCVEMPTPAQARTTMATPTRATEDLTQPPVKRMRKEGKAKASPAPLPKETKEPKGKPEETMETPEAGIRENWLVVAKAVRQMLKGLPQPYHVSADFLPALNMKISECILEAAKRAASNNRKTLRASDI